MDAWAQQGHLRRTICFEQQPGESLQKYATNFLEQVRVLEETFGPFVPTKDLVAMVKLTREVGEGEDVVEETYTEKVLADDDEIKVARDRFLLRVRFSCRSG